MKTIMLIAAMAATFSVNAQTNSIDNPCAEIITTQVDKFTEKTSKYLTNPIVTPNGNIIVLVGDKNTFVFSVYGIETGCIDEGAECIFLFEDGSKMTVYANSVFNCAGRCPIYSGGLFKNKSFYNSVSTKKISGIRIRTRSLPVEIELTPEQSDDLLQGITCLNFQY